MNESFIEQMINHKINQMTAGELVRLAKSYDIHITQREARKVLLILKKEKVRISDQKQVNKILKQVEKEVSPQAMKKAKKLFDHFMNR